MGTFIYSFAEATQNFLKVTQIVEKEGKAIIVKNNKTKHILIGIEATLFLKLGITRRLTLLKNGFSKNIKTLSSNLLNNYFGTSYRQNFHQTFRYNLHGFCL